MGGEVLTIVNFSNEKTTAGIFSSAWRNPTAIRETLYTDYHIEFIMYR